MENRTIQGLWIGDCLSVMEQLSICSYLANGHTYHLYVYDHVRGVPQGVVLRDAAEIVSKERIFRYPEHNSYAGFSNLFRYALLLEKGGWWSDTDTICLKPYDFQSDHVFSSEAGPDGADVVNVGAIKAPRGSPMLAYLADACQATDTRTIRWGQTGPRLAAAAVAKFGLHRHVQRAATFCPNPFPGWEAVLDPGRSWRFGPETYAVHLWNELWRRAGRDKDAVYPSECLYELLKQRYGLAATALTVQSGATPANIEGNPGLAVR